MQYGVTEYFEEKKEKANNKIQKGYQYPEKTPRIQSELGSAREGSKGAFMPKGLPFVTEGLVSSVTAFASNGIRNVKKSHLHTSLGFMASSHDGERNITNMGINSAAKDSDAKQIKNNASQIVLTSEGEEVIGVEQRNKTYMTPSSSLLLFNSGNNGRPITAIQKGPISPIASENPNANSVDLQAFNGANSRN